MLITVAWEYPANKVMLFLFTQGGEAFKILGKYLSQSNFTPNLDGFF